MRLIAALCIALCPATALAQSSWTDNAGVTHYSGSFNGSSYRDNAGVTHYNSDRGRGDAWTDNTGRTYYHGQTPFSED